MNIISDIISFFESRSLCYTINGHKQKTTTVFQLVMVCLIVVIVIILEKFINIKMSNEV